MDKICKTLQESNGENSYFLYTDKNNYIVETEDDGSTIYSYKNGKLIKIMYCPNGKLYYIHFKNL